MMSQRELKYKMALCGDSKAYYENYRPYSLIDGELSTTEGATDHDDDISSQSSAADLMFGDECEPTDSEFTFLIFIYCSNVFIR